MNKQQKYTEIMKQLNYETIGGVLLRLFGVVRQSKQLFCDCYIKYPRNPKKKCYKCGLTKKCTW
jgi:hypothetical protein